MSLIFNMLSRLVITFLPRNKCLLISWLQSPSAVLLEPRKIKSVTVSTVSPSICHEMMGLDAMVLVFWMLSFKPTVSLSSFTFIQRLFSSQLSAIRVVSPVYLRLLIFLLAILIPACASSSPAFLMMYSASWEYINKQVTIYSLDILLFLFGTYFCCSMSSSNCCFLTCMQVSQEAGQVVWYSISFRIFHSLLKPCLLRQPFGLFEFLFLGDGLDPSLLYNVRNLLSEFIRHSVYQI